MIRALLKKYKSQLGDSVWSITGLVLMNAVAQIAMFPWLRRAFSETGYGDLQYLMGYINMITMSVGYAAALARMVSPRAERSENAGDYNLFLLMISALGIPFTFLVRGFGGVYMDTPTTVCYYLLFVAMAFRYYADVSYKITLRYRRYFCYYAVIGVGYGLGTLLAVKTGVWPLAILMGEAAGVLFAYVMEPNLRRGFCRPSNAFSKVMRCILIFCVSEGISNVILNADRLILKHSIGAASVTVYYLATLVGKTMSLVTIPLNGVAIGYLMRYDGKLTRRVMRWLTLGALAAVVLFTALCVLGGWIVLCWLYPEDLAAVKPFLVVGSLAQVLYFVTSFMTVILVRFAKKGYQIIINAAFGVCFFGISVPVAFVGRDLWGFALAVVAANAVRLLVAIVLGYYHVLRAQRTPLPEADQQKEV